MEGAFSRATRHPSAWDTTLRVLTTLSYQRVRPTAFKLPGEGHTYGKPQDKDPHGAGDCEWRLRSPRTRSRLIVLTHTSYVRMEELHTVAAWGVAALVHQDQPIGIEGRVHHGKGAARLCSGSQGHPLQSTLFDWPGQEFKASVHGAVWSADQRARSFAYPSTRALSDRHVRRQLVRSLRDLAARTSRSAVSLRQVTRRSKMTKRTTRTCRAWSRKGCVL